MKALMDISFLYYIFFALILCSLFAFIKRGKDLSNVERNYFIFYLLAIISGVLALFEIYLYSIIFLLISSSLFIIFILDFLRLDLKYRRLILSVKLTATFVTILICLSSFVFSPKVIFPYIVWFSASYLLFTLALIVILLFFNLSGGDFKYRSKTEYSALSAILVFVFLSFPLHDLYEISISHYFLSTGIISFVIFGYKIFYKYPLKFKDFAVKATAYLILIFYGTLAFMILEKINLIAIENIADFPVWLVPFSMSISLVLAYVFIRFKLRQVNELKYEFVNVVTHKFRTPLTYIKWLTSDLLVNKEKKDFKDVALQIDIANQKLVELTDILINASKSSTGGFTYRLEKVSLNGIVKDVYGRMKIFIEHKNIKISFKYSEDIPHVSADPSKLRLVLQIVLENSINYTPKDGTIEVSTYSSGSVATFEIKDSGIGISKEDMPHIFNSFYRSKDATRTDTEGVGMGLYMVKNMVENQRGRVSIYSDGKGKGTTLKIYLPAVLKKHSH